ncbi:hypothetical protein KIH87_11940 [Paraneptunicella aestuarii]|uniref:hypothetical protein n=1 Tax=Paraneptunicella aestuarii TaxID=2831148 RepID=UPI001E5A8389|nr:hypothetical protein [Paraneptunicella aestuarii]UAA37424.1 hypothetical protein KIH87_11940 [Paraneptunicella aestuarii]
MKLGFTEAFVNKVISEITPFQHLSGTEHVAPMLYSLIRMLKPQTVVEFGSGYTTPYILQALKDNEDDFKLNQQILKKRAIKHYKKVSDPARKNMEPDDWLLDETTQEIYGQEPVIPIPSFYLKPYKPQLFTFEVLPGDDFYVQKLANLVKELKLDKYFTLNAACRVTDYVKLMPEDRLPIDFAWNDFGNKKRFYDETYEYVKGNGGIMAFHNTTNSEKDHQEDLDEVFNVIRPMLQDHTAELLTFLEPHKFTQRSLTVVRKLTDFKQEFFHDLTSQYDEDLLKLTRTRSDYIP